MLEYALPSTHVVITYTYIIHRQKTTLEENKIIRQLKYSASPPQYNSHLTPKLTSKHKVKNMVAVRKTCKQTQLKLYVFFPPSLVSSMNVPKSKSKSTPKNKLTST